eukprot:354103-Chlamydomonas_euryale.AAC.1
MSVPCSDPSLSLKCLPRCEAARWSLARLSLLTPCSASSRRDRRASCCLRTTRRTRSSERWTRTVARARCGLGQTVGRARCGTPSRRWRGRRRAWRGCFQALLQMCIAMVAWSASSDGQRHSGKRKAALATVRANGNRI